MEKILSNVTEIISAQAIENSIGKTMDFCGCIQRIRKLSSVAFLIIRLEKTLLQTVVENLDLITNLEEGDFVKFSGTVKTAKIKDKSICPQTAEVLVNSLSIVGKRSEPFPCDMSKEDLNVKQSLEFDLRNVTLRHPKRRAIFKIQETLATAFESFLSEHGFTRIFSPRIVFAGAEGGANTFQLNYFGKTAFLAQSPQFYKQYGVGIFGRVFETGTVFRAEKHDTSRHLNEYVSLDVEMGFITSFRELMALETSLLTYLFNAVKNKNSYELALLDAQVPEIPSNGIPALTLKEAHQIYMQETGQNLCHEPDLTPDEERYLSEWSAKNHNCELLFVTHFPTEKRPFYSKDDPEQPGFTASFDLIMRGIEITTGGQRIHNYDEQVQKLKHFGLNPEDFESFLQAHRYGLPPHGGFAIGLERLTAKICGQENIKAASMYPRDINRITP